MKLVSVYIKNFRSIKEIVVNGPINDIWAFVGQNNAGKSSVIHAIRAFYGDYAISSDDFCRMATMEEPIEIVLEYRLTDEERDELPVNYRLADNKLRVIKRFTRDNLKGVTHGFSSNSGAPIECDEEFFGAKNVHIGKLGNIIFVPAVKDLGEELKKTKSSIFTKLVSRIISEAVVALPSWNALVGQAQRFAEDLRSPVKDGGSGGLNSIHEIDRNLTELLSSWKLRSKISISPPTPEEIVLSGSRLLFLSDETGQEEDPLTLGSGAQRSIVNSLLLIWARVESKKPKIEKKKFNADLTLLLYEEPEALLHYDQEKKLLKNLEEIAASESGQVILSTHSPNFISTKSKALLSISRFERGGNGTQIYRASSDFLARLSAGENVFDFILWLNSDRNTMFFVDRVVLVEGPTDKVFLNYLISKNEIMANVYIVDCGSKCNVPRFMELCKEFGISHSVMYDEDDINNVNHLNWNSSIEIGRNTYTHEIKKITPNLEDYIGFKTPTQSYKKPIEILNHLKAGLLTNEKYIEFEKFIQGV